MKQDTRNLHMNSIARDLNPRNQWREIILIESHATHTHAQATMTPQKKTGNTDVFQRCFSKGQFQARIRPVALKTTSLKHMAQADLEETMWCSYCQKSDVAHRN